METPKKFYRYEAHLYTNIDSGEIGIPSYTISKFRMPTMCLFTYNLHKETPKGYWIGYGHPDNGYVKGDSIWVSKTSKKRYAYPTKEEALFNYIKRTEMRRKILEGQVDFCRSALMNAEKLMKKLKEE